MIIIILRHENEELKLNFTTPLAAELFRLGMTMGWAGYVWKFNGRSTKRKEIYVKLLHPIGPEVHAVFPQQGEIDVYTHGVKLGATHHIVTIVKEKTMEEVNDILKAQEPPGG